MAMTKFINNPDNIVPELLEGFALAHADKIQVSGDGLIVRAQPKAADKVALVTLGGSGHEPALGGFVGEGMLDVCAAGQIFAAPGPPKVLEALRAAKRDAGILFIVLNHEGDVMSADMAQEMAEAEGIKLHRVLTREDISAGTREDCGDRRGLAGCLAVIKAAGAAAEAGKSLEECAAIAERVERNMGTLAVALSGATHPATGDVIAEVEEGMMVVGMGQHGEAGGGTQPLKTADETAAIMAEALVNDIGMASGDMALAIVNGVGATTLMEQYVVLSGVQKYLSGKGIKLVASAAAEFLTVQEMAGFQLILAKIDAEILDLWNAPCNSPALFKA